MASIPAVSRSGGYNLRNTDPSIAPGPFDQETQDSFELGVKAAVRPQPDQCRGLLQPADSDLPTRDQLSGAAWRQPGDPQHRRCDNQGGRSRGVVLHPAEPSRCRGNLVTSTASIATSSSTSAATASSTISIAAAETAASCPVDLWRRADLRSTHRSSLGTATARVTL